MVHFFLFVCFIFLQYVFGDPIQTESLIRYVNGIPLAHEYELNFFLLIFVFVFFSFLNISPKRKVIINPVKETAQTVGTKVIFVFLLFKY